METVHCGDWCMPVRHPSAQSKTSSRLCALNFRPTFDLRHATDSSINSASLIMIEPESLHEEHFRIPESRTRGTPCTWRPRSRRCRCWQRCWRRRRRAQSQSDRWTSSWGAIQYHVGKNCWDLSTVQQYRHTRLQWHWLQWQRNKQSTFSDTVIPMRKGHSLCFGQFYFPNAAQVSASMCVCWRE